MSKAILRISFLEGTDIEAAIKEAIEIRKRLGLSVEFSFNGIMMFICSDNVKHYMQEYENELKRMIEKERGGQHERNKI